MRTNNQEMAVSSRNERPILFSGPMVRAILNGRKTQTRRVAKPQPETNPSVAKIFFGKHPFSPSCFRGTPASGLVGGSERMAWVAEDWCGNAIGVEEEGWLKCTYGQPGDRLWVRESFRIRGGDEYAYQKHQGSVVYREGCELIDDGPWNPSIHMPRWASRITLEIEAVRVERVQDISENDAKLEGIESVHCENFGAWKNYTFETSRPKHGVSISDERHRIVGYQSATKSFRSLWDSINAKRGFGWDTNPWVWVIQFKRI